MGAVYLDYAATSAIRPPEVVESVARYLTDIGATPGRSGHARALEAGRVALRCRARLAELLGVGGDPGRIAFQMNATHALNTGIFGVLKPGDRVVRTSYDHNAVRRPLAALAGRGIEVARIEVDAAGSVDLTEVEAALEGDGLPARLLVVPHASNVTGVVLPVKEMAALAREVGALTLVDLAQTAGHYPIDVDDLGVDLAAFTGHKGLLGPQGIGGLWVREGVDVEPLLRGGTGGDSVPAGMPALYPDHLEAGTQNGPGMAGLLAAAEWLLDRGVDALHREELALRKRLVSALDRVAGVQIRSPVREPAVGIVSLVHESLDPGELARRIERSHGIQARAGLHCAPEAHESMGTVGTGALRLSLGWASTAADVDDVIAALDAAPRTLESDRCED